MKVLYAEDEAGARRMIARNLLRVGITAVTAENGVEALAMFIASRDTEEPFRVVLTDLSMPNMGGEELIRSIQGLDDSVKFVVMSGLSTEEEERVASNLRAQGHKVLPKPVNMDELIATVRDNFASS